MYYLFRLLFIVLRVINGALLVYVILSWVAPGSPLYGTIGRLVEPIVRPFRALSRRLLGRFAIPVDFSVFFAMIGIEILRYFLIRLYVALL